MNRVRNGKYLICKKCQKPFYVNPSRINLRVHCSKKCAAESFGESHSGINNNNWRKFGEAHPKYIKDRTKLKKKNERYDSAYRDFVSQVKKRDGNRCMDCGEIKEGKGAMEVNHIFGWVAYPRLRYFIENGEVLCKSCHLIKTKVQRKEKKIYIYA